MLYDMPITHTHTRSNIHTHTSQICRLLLLPAFAKYYYPRAVSVPNICTLFNYRNVQQNFPWKCNFIFQTNKTTNIARVDWPHTHTPSNFQHLIEASPSGAPAPDSISDPGVSIIVHLWIKLRARSTNNYFYSNKRIKTINRIKFWYFGAGFRSGGKIDTENSHIIGSD